MNWTGGSLQRTKHANKGVVQKQKAFFAKARTHLQNSPKSPATPFRPTYLQNDSSFELSSHLPPFEASPIQHTRHSAQRRLESIQRSSSPVDHTFADGDGLKSTLRKGRQEPSDGNASATRLRGSELRGMLTNEQRKKRRVDGTDLETELFEANRKRLLRQRDWIGVAPSRPVNLHFTSSKEKSKVGRRRKVEGRHGAVARRRIDIDFVTQPFEPAGDQHAGSFVGDMRRNLNDIRVRIGTDALTTACSADPDEDERSHASSDLMLFDQQTHDTEQPEAPKTIQHEVQEVHRVDHIPTPSHDSAKRGDSLVPTGRARDRLSSPQLTTEYALPERDISRNFRMRHTLSGFANRSMTKRAGSSDDLDQGFRTMQHFHGIDQPLRLVFPASISSDLARSGTTLHKHGHDGTIHAFETSHAGKSQIGHMHRLGNDNGPHPESEAAPAVSIVDEKPWKSFLNIPNESSSHSATANDSEKSVLHQHPRRSRREAERSSWSQHATQGDQTHTSSSFISASLPSVKRDIRTRHSAQDPRTRANRVNQATPREMNGDELIWQKFVLGSNDAPSSVYTHACEDVEQSMSKGSSGYLPLSVAVSSISSPFRPAPQSGPGMRYDVHDAARFAPPEFRSIPSPAGVPAGFVEELNYEDEDESTADRKVLRDSMIHASLLANTSGESDLLSTRMFSCTETSRNGLEHSSHSRASFHDRAQADCGATGREPEWAPVYDIPDSEDDGLCLVDANRS